MLKKLSLIAVAVVALGFVPGAMAGDEMVTDNSATYNYAPPPPPPVYYYAPPPVRVVVYPEYAYYRAPLFRGYGYHRSYGRRPYWNGHHRR